MLGFVHRYADRIIVLNSAMKQELESLGFDPGRLIMLGCEADATKFCPAEPGEKERLYTRGPRGQRDRSYFRGLSRSRQGLHALLDALALLYERLPETVLMMPGMAPWCFNSTRLLARITSRHM
jgi:glycosyltransferase involved in cell wall biosynthesis